MKHERCGRCRRVLRTQASQVIGFGPVCVRKVEVEMQALNKNVDKEK